MTDKINFQQLENYKNGFPFLNVAAPATPRRGIVVLSEKDQTDALEFYDEFAGKIVKFVPASGAASRMFKDLFEAKKILENGGSIPKDSPAGKFFKNLEKFPFYDLSSFKGLSELQILDYVLGHNGLNYSGKAKGQLLFHKYPTEARTAFEEHLVEGGLYAKCLSDSVVRIHFTVSKEHRRDFEALYASLKGKYEKRFNCRYDVSFSVQDPDSDIIAVNEDNTPFIKSDGTPLYRPGGHGALLKNLNEIDGDIVIIKNIDNIVREDLVGETVRWKKILAGKLIQTRAKVFEYLRELDRLKEDSHECEMPPRCYLAEIAAFLRFEFQVAIPNIPEALMPDFLRAKLDRPIRVCGMVRNEGEPGGGPFIVYDADGSTSLQILESFQLDPDNSKTAAMLKESTHFNPVDLSCSIRNYKGEKFDLAKFTDPSTGSITHKSYEGRPLKAQELPGLWNGSMSNWNTMFVETPLITFNPVKTVLDLLRKEHAE